MFKLASIRAATALLVLTSALACGKARQPTEPELGTNTNWLRSCASDDECDPDGECLCGVCTLACSAHAQCDDLRRASCVPLEASTCGARASGSACLEDCETDDDCTRSDGRCLDGACVASEESLRDAGATAQDSGELTGDAQLPECEFAVDSSGHVPSQGGAGGASGIDGSGGAGGTGGMQAVEECFCTRRPGDGQSFRCPVGSGVSVTAEVGPAGGTVMLGGTASTVGVPVELRIPPNALSEIVTFRITETSVAPLDDVSDWSPLYLFEPEDVVFATPAEVAHAVELELGAGRRPQDLLVGGARRLRARAARGQLPERRLQPGFGAHARLGDRARTARGRLDVSVS